MACKQFARRLGNVFKENVVFKYTLVIFFMRYKEVCYAHSR